jgi:hypothetical protein
MRRVVLLAEMGVLFAFAFGGAAGRAAEAGTVLDETCYWRRYYQFAVSRYSPAVLKAEGERILGRRGLARVKRDTERWLRRRGIDPGKVDWRDRCDCAMLGARAFNPTPTPPPPGDWMKVDFDDGSWVRRRGPCQAAPPVRITFPGLGQYDGSVDLRLRAAFYRARFLAEDVPAAGALTLRVVYSGGTRVFVNGQEVARGHLTPGEVQPDAAAADYPARAYDRTGSRLRDRVLGPVRIPPQLLRKGPNVLAVEVRASHFHPIVLTHPRQPNWGGPVRPFPHARLSRLTLTSSSAAVRHAARRPPGLQVWVQDMHHRTESTEHLPPGEGTGTVRFVGAANGTYSAQLAVLADRPLADVAVRAAALKQADGSAALDPSAMLVKAMIAYPADQWTLKRLGDERGLAATFPSAVQLAEYARMSNPRPAYLFDRIGQTPRPVAPVAAGKCFPLWLSIRVPAGAAPGKYLGSIAVSAGGAGGVSIPVELEIVNWRLPDPKDFQTLVGCEQNPYAVARQYGVRLWSDRHFELIAGSLRQLGRLGSGWVNVPVLVQTEFGNQDDSMIRWIRRRDGGLAFDYKVLDRYLDLALKHLGRLDVVQFAVMHGMPGAATPPAPPRVKVYDELGRRSSLLPVGASRAGGAWRAFATALHDHMKARGLAKAMYWGYPLEREADPALKGRLASFAPGVFWIAGPHEMMANGTYAKNERFYRIVADIRYHGGWRSFRDDRGWKSQTVHLLNPRVGGTVIGLHTTSLPFAYRLMPDRAIAMGRSGFTRVGADEWAGVHYSGMQIPKWLTGMGVLFVLWPGTDGAQSSARFEAMLEGVQEAEARIFMERAVDRGDLPQPLARRVREVLAGNLRETTFLLGNSVIRDLEEYHHRWQERSRRLYRMAAEVARVVGVPRR